MYTLFTISEVMEAVDAHKAVFAGSLVYPVITDAEGRYLILCTLNNHCTGLKNSGLCDFYTIN